MKQNKLHIKKKNLKRKLLSYKFIINGNYKSLLNNSKKKKN